MYFAALIVCYVVGIVNLALFLLKMHADYQYNHTKLGELEQIMDSMKGYKKTWSYARNFYISIISIAYIVSYHVGYIDIA